MEMLNTTTYSRTEYLTSLEGNHWYIVKLINYAVVCAVVSLFGVVANVINVVVFYRQGLDTTINISFFSLTISDLCGLLLQQLISVYSNPFFLDLDLPISYQELQHLTAGLMREMFARITCLITAFITAERCMCVVFPLHIKRVITPRVTGIVIVVIYVSTLASALPVCCTVYITWKTIPGSNRTILGIAFTRYNAQAEAVTYLLHAFFTLLGFLSVLTFTLILAYQLGQKSAWRQTANVDQEKAKSMSKRDRGTITMVVLIAGILVVTYTPAVLLGLTTFIEPEFAVGGRYHNMYFSLWSFAILFENINSSVNIFLYHKMSSKYRHTFTSICVCLKSSMDSITTQKPQKLEENIQRCDD